MLGPPFHLLTKVMQPRSFESQNLKELCLIFSHYTTYSQDKITAQPDRAEKLGALRGGDRLLQRFRGQKGGQEGFFGGSGV